MQTLSQHFAWPRPFLLFDYRLPPTNPTFKLSLHTGAMMPNQAWCVSQPCFLCVNYTPIKLCDCILQGFVTRHHSDRIIVTNRDRQIDNRQIHRHRQKYKHLESTCSSRHSRSLWGLMLPSDTHKDSEGGTVPASLLRLVKTGHTQTEDSTTDTVWSNSLSVRDTSIWHCTPYFTHMLATQIDGNKWGVTLN